jgi:hypothetical protein
MKTPIHGVDRDKRTAVQRLRRSQLNTKPAKELSTALRYEREL